MFIVWEVDTMSASDKWQAGDQLKMSLGCAKCGKIVNLNEEHQCNDNSENDKETSTEDKSNHDAG